MEMQEMTRIITGLRSAGVTDKEILDLLLYIVTGEEKYKFSFATATPIYRGQDVIISGQNGAYRGIWENALLPKYYE